MLGLLTPAGFADTAEKTAAPSAIKKSGHHLFHKTPGDALRELSTDCRDKTESPTRWTPDILGGEKIAPPTRHAPVAGLISGLAQNGIVSFANFSTQVCERHNPIAKNDLNKGVFNRIYSAVVCRRKTVHKKCKKQTVPKPPSAT